MCTLYLAPCSFCPLCFALQHTKTEMCSSVFMLRSLFVVNILFKILRKKQIFFVCHYVQFTYALSPSTPHKVFCSILENMPASRIHLSTTAYFTVRLRSTLYTRQQRCGAWRKWKLCHKLISLSRFRIPFYGSCGVLTVAFTRLHKSLSVRGLQNCFLLENFVKYTEA
jgi:hypothetical protein